MGQIYDRVAWFKYHNLIFHKKRKNANKITSINTGMQLSKNLFFGNKKEKKNEIKVK